MRRLAKVGTICSSSDGIEGRPVRFHRPPRKAGYRRKVMALLPVLSAPQVVVVVGVGERPCG